MMGTTATRQRLPKKFWDYTRKDGPIPIEPIPHDRPTPLAAIPAERSILIQSRPALGWAVAGNFDVYRGDGAHGYLLADDESQFRRMIESAAVAGFEIGVGEREER